MGQEFFIKAGSTRPKLRVEISAQESDTVTAVTFSMSRLDNGQVILDHTSASIESQATSTVGAIVGYQWQDEDLDVAGVYKGEFEATFSDGRKEYYPSDDYLVINVQRPIGYNQPPGEANLSGGGSLSAGGS